MLSLSKMVWGVRALLYKVRFSSIGRFCYIGKPVSLVGTRSISLGDRVRIYPGVRMEAHGKGSIVIEDDVSIGQNFHVISEDSELRIGKKTTISGNVLVTNVDHKYDRIEQHVMKQGRVCSSTSIGSNSFVGYGAVLQAGTVLGKQCVVGANSVVRGVFPDFCVIVGVPARIVKRLNTETGIWERVKGE